MNDIETERAYMRKAFPHPPPTEWFESRILPSSWALAGNLNGKRVLDYGCNSGWVAYHARKQGANASATDIFGDACEPSIDFRPMDDHRIPWMGREFDLVLFGNVLHHGPLERHIAELARVLKKPGGFFVSLQEPCIPSSSNEESVLKQHCAQEIADGIDERRPCLDAYRAAINANLLLPRFFTANAPMWSTSSEPLAAITGNEHSGGLAIISHW